MSCSLSSVGFAYAKGEWRGGARAFLPYAQVDKPGSTSLSRSLSMPAVRRDIRDLQPGEDWELSIRWAIGEDALVFLACFSRAGLARPKSYQYEELPV